VIVIVKLGENQSCYEYPSPTILTGLSSKYIAIPSSIILNTDMDSKRVAVFSYFMIHKGLCDDIYFSVPDVVKWCGLKPDTRADGVSKKFVDVINDLKNEGYLTYSEELGKVSPLRGEFDTEKVIDECQTESFAIIYSDELKAIINYKKENNKDAFLNSTTLLLVFAFFRNAIYRRPNKLRPEERNVSNLNNHDVDIERRRSLYPEAYADTYKDISDKIGLSARTISKAVDVLEQQLGLLVTDAAYRVKNDEGKFNTQQTIFANAYKREREFLLAIGEEYSRDEIERKAENIRKYNNSYVIDKRKRKPTKGDY